MGSHTAIVAAHKDHGAHGCGKFEADGADGARCELHGVIDRKTRSHTSSGAGDEYGDGTAGVSGIEQADLLAKVVGHRGFDVSRDGEFAAGEHLVIDAGERDASGGFTHGEGADDGGLTGVHRDSFLVGCVVRWVAARRGRASYRVRPSLRSSSVSGHAACSCGSRMSRAPKRWSVAMGVVYASRS